MRPSRRMAASAGLVSILRDALRSPTGDRNAPQAEGGIFLATYDREAGTNSLYLQFVDLAGVAGEDLLPVGVAQEGHRVDVALGVVVVVAGLRIDAAHRAHDLGSEQDVVGRNGLE